MVNYEAQKHEAQLDAVFTALAHPARRAMLTRLGRGEASVGELAEPLAMSLPAVTKHLKVLERARLISRGRHAQWRPCRLEEAPLNDASGWIEAQRKVWESRFDRLESYLHVMQKELAQKEAEFEADADAGKAKQPKQPKESKGKKHGQGH